MYVTLSKKAPWKIAEFSRGAFEVANMENKNIREEWDKIMHKSIRDVTSTNFDDGRLMVLAWRGSNFRLSRWPALSSCFHSTMWGDDAK